MSGETAKEDNIIYTKEAFYDSTAPFEHVYQFKDDEFTHKREIEKMSDRAKLVGVRNFKTLYKDYCALVSRSKGESISEKTTNFDGQPLELNSGIWTADDNGIRKMNRYDAVDVACVHPIMPVRRLVNIDTGIEKLELAYRKGRGWKKSIYEKRKLASSKSIVDLANDGIAVTSESAKHLVTYIHDLENLNYDILPEVNAVSRLGWMGEEGFSPYVDNLVFDGGDSFRHLFGSVKEHGTYDTWLDFARKTRAEEPVITRIVLAASFASVLVQPCGALPFFVHLWGGSGNGKTVGVMLAVSVWANPEQGKYWNTFNSTSVGQELSAGFVNNLPLILDELQISKDRKDFDKMIYELAEGVGRLRGKVDGGIQKIQTWKNCILTTGEQPILTHSSGGGAVNRVIEINCEGTNLFADPIKASKILCGNYGFAGHAFVDFLQKDQNMEKTKQLQEEIYKTIIKGETTEKQALAASLILTADAVATEHIFMDGKPLKYEDMTQYLSTKAEVSQNERAYNWLCDWIAQNRSHFQDDVLDTWGSVNNGEVYFIKIIRSVFDSACQDAGYNPSSFLSWMKRKGLINVDGKGLTKRTRINGMLCQCVVLKLSPDGFSEIVDEDLSDLSDLPF